MIYVVVAGMVLLVSLTLISVIEAQRIDREVRALDESTRRLVRLAVALDDLAHETGLVRPAIGGARRRASALRRTEYRQLPR